MSSLCTHVPQCNYILPKMKAFFIATSCSVLLLQVIGTTESPSSEICQDYDYDTDKFPRRNSVSGRQMETEEFNMENNLYQNHLFVYHQWLQFWKKWVENRNREIKEFTRNAKSKIDSMSEQSPKVEQRNDQGGPEKSTKKRIYAIRSPETNQVLFYLPESRMPKENGILATPLILYINPTFTIENVPSTNNETIGQVSPNVNPNKNSFQVLPQAVKSVVQPDTNEKTYFVEETLLNSTPDTIGEPLIYFSSPNVVFTVFTKQSPSDFSSTDSRSKDESQTNNTKDLIESSTNMPPTQHVTIASDNMIKFKPTELELVSTTSKIQTKTESDEDYLTLVDKRDFESEKPYTMIYDCEERDKNKLKSWIDKHSTTLKNQEIDKDDDLTNDQMRLMIEEENRNLNVSPQTTTEYCDCDGLNGEENVTSTEPLELRMSNDETNSTNPKYDLTTLKVDEFVQKNQDLVRSFTDPPLNEEEKKFRESLESILEHIESIDTYTTPMPIVIVPRSEENTTFCTIGQCPSDNIVDDATLLETPLDPQIMRDAESELDPQRFLMNRDLGGENDSLENITETNLEYRFVEQENYTNTTPIDLRCDSKDDSQLSTKELKIEEENQNAKDVLAETEADFRVGTTENSAEFSRLGSTEIPENECQKHARELMEMKTIMKRLRLIGLNFLDMGHLMLSENSKCPIIPNDPEMNKNGVDKPKTVYPIGTGV